MDSGPAAVLARDISAIKRSNPNGRCCCRPLVQSSGLYKSRRWVSMANGGCSDPYAALLCPGDDQVGQKSRASPSEQQYPAVMADLATRFYPLPPTLQPAQLNKLATAFAFPATHRSIRTSASAQCLPNHFRTPTQTVSRSSSCKLFSFCVQDDLADVSSSARRSGAEAPFVPPEEGSTWRRSGHGVSFSRSLTKPHSSRIVSSSASLG